MFFIGGVMPGRKVFDRFRQLVTCRRCGQYAALEAFMTYTYFMFFFIPLFKWGKQYFVRSTCCGTVWQIPREKGEAIARGEAVELTDADLTPTGDFRPIRRCAHCGCAVEESFSYCPNCGSPLS